MVMASGWQSFDRQFEPYLRAFMAAPLRCGLGAVPEPMVEYINPGFLYVVMVVFVVLGSIPKERWGYMLSSIQTTTK